MSELGPDAKALLNAARAGDEPNDLDRARIKSRIARRVTVGVAAGAAIGTAAKSASAGASVGVGAGASIGMGLKVMLALGVASAAGVMGVSYVESKHPSTAPASAAAPGQTTMRILMAPMPPRASSASRIPPPAPEPSAADDPTPVVPPPSERVSPAPSAPAPVRTNALAPSSAAPTSPAAASLSAAASGPASVPAPSSAAPEGIAPEIALIGDAHAAILAGNGGRALELLEEHARRFPNGALSEEREAARVFALCSTGRSSEAHAAGARFLGSFPRSPHAARVRSSCGAPF